MKWYKIVRITLGLGLIATGVYTGNAWFFLGIIPFAMGFVNYCPIESRLGNCKDGVCEDGSCCSDETNCCTPAQTAVQTPTAAKAAPLSGFSTAPKEQSCCSSDTTIKIEILGTGCAKCIALQKIVEEVVSELEGDFTVTKVDDIEKIMAYNVLSTPGFVINGEVKSSGKLLSKAEIKDLLDGTIAKIEENSSSCSN